MLLAETGKMKTSMALWRGNQDLVLKSEMSEIPKWKCQVDPRGKCGAQSRGLDRREKFRTCQHIGGIYNYIPLQRACKKRVLN